MSSAGSRAVGMDVSSYVIRGLMVDTGFHRARAELLAAVRAHHVRGAIVTHWHEDHAGNLQMLVDHGLPISMRADTETTVRTRPAIQLYRRVVWGHPPAVTSAVRAFDDHGLELIHTPGHSSDHQVVWDGETGTVFSGDLWLGVRARILHSTEDPYQIIESLRIVRAFSPERMFDAHRGFVSNATQAIDEKIDWLSEMLATMARDVRAGMSDREIVRRRLGGEEPAAYVSRGDYSRRNLVKAVRRRIAG